MPTNIDNSSIISDIESLIIESDLDRIEELKFQDIVDKLFRRKKPKRVSEQDKRQEVKQRNAQIWYAVQRLKQSFNKSKPEKNDADWKNGEQVKKLTKEIYP